MPGCKDIELTWGNSMFQFFYTLKSSFLNYSVPKYDVRTRRMNDGEDANRKLGTFAIAFFDGYNYGNPFSRPRSRILYLKCKSEFLNLFIFKSEFFNLFIFHAF